jgi:hypothetical protein
MKTWIAVAAMFAASAAAQKPVSVPTAPPATAKELAFRDSQFGVRFRVPPGWSFTRKDRQVSVFRLDARTATDKSVMRGVAALDFNPFPLSTLAGAMVYYSVERHARESECVRQAAASGDGTIAPAPPPNGSHEDVRRDKDTLDIGGMNFVHGHDEHGKVCVEARDDIYTAYRKGACYRFDLEMNTFCAVSSGAVEITTPQIENIEARMAEILSTVSLDWNKTGAHPVKPPSVEERRPLPPPEAPAKLPVQTGGS